METVDHHHIIETGSNGLFLDSLQRCLFFPDGSVLDAALSLIHKILSNKSFKCGDRDLLDQIMDIIMRSILMSTSVESKTISWKHMSSFINLQELAMVRYAKKFIKLIDDQLSHPLMDASEQLFVNVLQSMSSFIEVTSPRVKIYSPQLLLSLMSFEDNNRESLKKRVTVRLLMRRVIVQLERLDKESCDSVSRITSSQANGV
jgi:hypothetical protein